MAHTQARACDAFAQGRAISRKGGSYFAAYRKTQIWEIRGSGKGMTTAKFLQGNLGQKGSLGGQYVSVLTRLKSSRMTVTSASFEAVSTAASCSVLFPHFFLGKPRRRLITWQLAPRKQVPSLHDGLLFNSAIRLLKTVFFFLAASGRGWTA